MTSARTCTTPECDRMHYGKGLCKYHYYKEWHAANPEKGAAYTNKYRMANLEKTREASRVAMRNHYEKNREVRIQRSTEWNHVRRARLAEADSEKYSTQDVIDLYGVECHICELPIDLDAPRKIGLPGWEKGLHLDHVQSLADGGSDLLSNIRPAHGLCNLSKG